MASLPEVYDVAIDSVGADAAANTLRQAAARARLRCWGAGWSALPGNSFIDELRFASATSRTILRVIGDCCERDLERQLAARDAVMARRPVIVLAPGCPVGPGEFRLGNSAVIDQRNNLSPLPVVELSNRVGLSPSDIRRRLVDSYNLIADKFEARWVNHPPLQPIEQFLRLLPRRASILDAGCGPGHHAAVLARGGNDVTGIDISDGMLAIARRSVSRPQFLRMDMQLLHFPPQSFDGIWCAAAALHVPRENMRRVLRGFRRVLRPLGLLGLNTQVGRLSEVVDYEGDHRFFEYYRDAAELGRLAASESFEVIESDYGETGRNTHGLDVTLRWVTLYLRRA